MPTSDELQAAVEVRNQSSQRTHDGVNFRVPNDLEVSPTGIKRMLLIGQCILNPWAYVLEKQYPTLSVEHVLFNFAAELPDAPNLPIGEYDFQVVALPLRGLIHESKYLNLLYLDLQAVEQLFAEACEQMALFLRMAMKWNTKHSVLTFVANFLVPQQNPNGRLLPRYDLRNLACFVERINERLAQELGNYRNSYLLDVDQISASIGRRYVQDDSVTTTAHGSMLANFADDQDQNRLEPPPLPITSLYNAKIGSFVTEIWREIQGMYRTIRQIDSVKMVIMDLDDTLWRGVLAELETISGDVIEGWPLGVIEALAFLRKRGVILAIVSKNEEANVERIFARLLRNRLPLSSFPLRRINWLPKVQNIAELIQEASLLPRSVVFVDDNPVERASVAAAFPDLRVVGADPYALKRILLWSPETQVVSVTDESAKRGDMIQAQVSREATRKTLSREDFLASLELKIYFRTVSDPSDRSFPRAFELLNKTNQFNTTGVRWTLEEIGREMSSGLKLICFTVEDKFTEYGLVGVVLLKGCVLVQYVMSCRVLGLDVERAALSYALDAMKQSGCDSATALFRETNANLPCRTLYADNGFSRRGEDWALEMSSAGLALSPHIEVVGANKSAAAVAGMQVAEQVLPGNAGEVSSLIRVASDLEYPASALEKGRAYPFGGAGAMSWMGEAQGLGRRERWGVWTTADLVVMPLRVDPGTADVVGIAIRLRPYLVNQSSRKGLEISGNNMPLSAWKFTGELGEEFTANLSIPSTSLGPAGELFLVLKIEKSASPKQLGLSEDARKLGFALIDLRQV